MFTLPTRMHTSAAPGVVSLATAIGYSTTNDAVEASSAVTNNFDAAYPRPYVQQPPTDFDQVIGPVVHDLSQVQAIHGIVNGGKPKILPGVHSI